MNIDDVCLSYRHDFGLLPESDKHRIRSVAESWLHAFEKHGFGYLGDAEAKQPDRPGELTRADFGRVKALIDHMVEQSNDADTLDGANFTRNRINVELDAIYSRILSDRAAIADLEKRLENAVGIDWKDQVSPLIPWETINSTRVVIVAYDMAGQQVKQLAYIPRPAPAKLTPEQMAEAWMEWAETINGPHNVYDKGDARGELLTRLLSGKSIETLYAEIKGGGT